MHADRFLEGLQAFPLTQISGTLRALRPLRLEWHQEPKACLSGQSPGETHPSWWENTSCFGPSTPSLQLLGWGSPDPRGDKRFLHTCQVLKEQQTSRATLDTHPNALLHSILEQLPSLPGWIKPCLHPSFPLS